MRNLIRALAFAAALTPLAALGQSAAPPNLPAQSVWGRLGIPGDTGPGQAIPMARLNIFLLASLCQTNNAMPVYSTSQGKWICTPTQTANTVLAGPGTGSAAQGTYRALVGADLPLPAASTLGGVKSLAAVSHNFLTSIGTDGGPTQAQPAFSDLTGSIAAGQIPANVITSAMIRQGVARSVIGVAGNATANEADIQGTADQVLIVNSAATALSFGQVNLSAAAAVTGTLPVARGGTGDTGTAWTTFTPSPSCGTATITTNSARSKTLGKTMWLEASFTVTVVGTCSSALTFTLPSVTAQSDAGLAGRDTGGAGKGVGCSITASGTTAVCSKGDASQVVINERWQISGVFETQ